MKIISWNCKGLGKGETVRYLTGLVKKHKSHCVFLMETKGKFENMKRMCEKLGFKNYEIVEAIGKAGGLTLMWTDDINLVSG